jgi:hypothetical protein
MRLPLALAVAALLTAQAPAVAEAHHGFNGRYDRSKPLYIEGQITQAAYSFPHGLITIEPSSPSLPPADLLQLTSNDYARLGGRDVVTRSQPIQATGGGVIVLLLTPPMTTEVAARPAQPSRGQSVGAIVFRECSTGELRVQLLRISATDTLVRQGVLQREVDGCDPPPATVSTATATPSAIAVAPTAAAPVPVETKERADGPAALLLLAAAAIAGLAALALGLALARRARS